MAKRIRSSRGFFILFGTFWCGLLAVFDGVFAVQAYKQIDAARRFLPTPATVVSSEVESHYDSDGTTYSPEVRFEYTVGGQTYTSDKVHFAVWSSSDSSEAYDIVNRFPAGSETTAYYDPGKPSRAILLPGVGRLPWFLALFLTPFHCVGIGVWIGVLTGRSGTYEEVVLAKTIHRDDGTRAVLRSSRVALWIVFLSVVGGGSFLSIFILALTMGFGAPPGVVFGVLGGLSVLGVLACVAVRTRKKPDTVIDRARRTIGRPGMMRSDRFGVFSTPTGFDEVEAVRVESKSWGEVNDVPHFHHKVLAERTGGAEPLELVRVSGPAGFAEPLAAWVREQIGLAENEA